MVTVVAQKLTLLPLPICHLIITTCKQILLQVLALESSNELKEYFECVEYCLHHTKGTQDSVCLITVFEIIEQTYSVCSQAKQVKRKNLISLFYNYF